MQNNSQTRRPTPCFIILNWNGVKKTVACLNSLLENEYPFHVYILDNGSEAGEYEVLEKTYGTNEKITLIRSERNLGFTGGVNSCLEESLKKGYAWYCLLNNDAEVPSDFIRRTMSAIEFASSDIGIFGPKILFQDNKGIIQSEGGSVSLITGFCPGNRTGKTNSPSSGFIPTDYVSGCCFFIKDEVLRDIGKLDDRFFAYYEEVDYCLMAKKKGYSVGVFSELEIFHDQSSSSKKYTGLTTFLMFRNRMLFLKKHAGFIREIGSFAYLFPYLVFIFIKYGPVTTKYAINGTWEGMFSKNGDPFASHGKEYFLRIKTNGRHGADEK